MTRNQFHVLTGGPGAGKTTLLDALAETGLRTAPEAGRAVILAQQAIGGSALPWADRALFAELMLAFDMRSYAQARMAAAPCLFDRAVPDLIGYLRLEGLAVPAHFRRAAELHRYDGRVFILPPWQEIYSGDTERRQDWETAVATHAAVKAAYEECGYALCEVPKLPVEARRAFVLARLAP